MNDKPKPKFEVGDEVWTIDALILDEERKLHIFTGTTIRKAKIHYAIEEKDHTFAYAVDFDNKRVMYLHESWIFYTEEEAETALKSGIMEKP